MQIKYIIRTGKALSKHSKWKQMKGGIQRYFVDYRGVSIETKTPSQEIEEGDDLPF